MNPKEIRLKRRLNQTEFWTPLGVSQSSGSRFEAGRPLPKTILTLLLIAYGTKQEADHIVKALRT